MSIYTDGGCVGNPGPGGWAAILQYKEHQRSVSGGEWATTNNRMELRAAIAGLAMLKEPCEVTVYTDSEYLRKGVTEWLKSWKARGWITATRKPVRNADLWRELDAKISTHRMHWKWVKGHAGHEQNEKCDRLAAAQIEGIRRKVSAKDLADALDQFRRTQAPATNSLPEALLLTDG